MKKHGCIIFAAIFVLGLFMVTANAQATEAEAPEVHFSGLIEFGGAMQQLEFANGDDEDESDLCLTTVELEAEAEVNEWVSVAALLLYEDATSFEGENDETHVELEEATVTIENAEEYPLYLTAGKMYVPFGALLTHFPDDPLIDAPVTLLLGETLEKALLVGMKHEGFLVSAYVFNGDMDELEEDKFIEGYGLDVNYTLDDETGFDILIGASYISNITDSDFVTEALEEELLPHAFPGGYDDAGVKDYVAGVAGYLHVGLDSFFVDAEYMTALDEVKLAATLGAVTTEFDTDEKPAVWNVEAGYNLDWGKNLEIVLKYAGSSDAGGIGIPEQRYGICLNQDIFEDVIVSLGYLRDDYDEDEDLHQRDERDLVFAQIAIEF